jgi:hypothetical protein
MDIKTPMTTAMKKQARAAIDLLFEPPVITLTPATPAKAATTGPDPSWNPPYNDFTPREHRANVVKAYRGDRSQIVAGWFIEFDGSAVGADGLPAFKAAANEKVKV